MKRNLLRKAAIGLLAALILTGGAFADVTVNYLNFSSSGDVAPNLTAMKNAFEKLNPGIKVNIETIAFAQYFNQLQTRAAAGTLPDSFELDYENFIAYAKRNLLLDMGSLIKSTKFDTSVLAPKALAAFSYGGKQYGLPESFSTVVLFYNKELFDRAKVAYPTDSWTWKDMQAAAEKIRALDKSIYGLLQPVQFWEFYKVVRQNGGGLISPDGKKFTVNTPQNVATLTTMIDRINKSNVIPTTAQMGGMGDWDLFKSGRLGMIVNGIWAFNEFIRDCYFPWDIVVEPGNTAKATHFFANGVAISGTSKNAKEALEWIKFLAASKEAADIRIDASWELPAVVNPEVVAKYSKITPPDNRAAVFKSLDYSVAPVVCSQQAEMQDIINSHLTAAKEAKETPAQALAAIQKELEAKIKL
jgi:multiple sugar transport system substrate-binding protein